MFVVLHPPSSCPSPSLPSPPYYIHPPSSLPLSQSRSPPSLSLSPSPPLSPSHLLVSFLSFPSPSNLSLLLSLPSSLYLSPPPSPFPPMPPTTLLENPHLFSPPPLSLLSLSFSPSLQPHFPIYLLASPLPLLPLSQFLPLHLPVILSLSLSHTHTHTHPSPSPPPRLTSFSSPLSLTLEPSPNLIVI